MKYSVGIDLGTSNSALAVLDLSVKGELQCPRVVPITQLTAPGSIGELSLLPSALYIPAEGEFSKDSVALPWHGENQPPFVVGALARDRGAVAPDRVVVSAKSWLCNPKVDRAKKILPSDSKVESNTLVSPLEASTEYLKHLRHTLQHHFYLQGGGLHLHESAVVVTVPASFDEVARLYTHQAAEAAGLGQVVLLEEPVAAFYAWLAANEESWRSQITKGDLVLVCDIGGGTADFSLIAVNEENGNLHLERISVGEHILLGGDNIDLALAYTLRAKLESQGVKLDHWQFLSLVHQAREGKERLLADDGPTEISVGIASRGSSLFAQSISIAITRDEVLRVVLDGFFPLTAVTDFPAGRSGIGLQEIGLSYASDPAVSKHLGRFLQRSHQNVLSDQALSNLVESSFSKASDLQSAAALVPTKVLFNGGCCAPARVRQRLIELLSGWRGAEVLELHGADLAKAVAVGAAVYGRLRTMGEGIRIRAGLSQSYYIGLESSRPAVPGFSPPVKGVCIAPQGMEEGAEHTLSGQRFGLVVGEPVEFRFFSSEVRAGDLPGAIVEDAVSELEESARLEVNLNSTAAVADGLVIDEEPAFGEVIPVELQARVTELGVFELWMRRVVEDYQIEGAVYDGAIAGSPKDDSRCEQIDRWKVEFVVRR